MGERLINRRQQGDLGEASAIEWLTRQGATVSVPLGHSPDYDLLAEIDGELLRIQVKTSVSVDRTPNGDQRYPVRVATTGGNQSWTRVVKRFDGTRADYLFVLVGDGRRWFIPAIAVEAETTITLGGIKYSEHEVEPACSIRELIYRDACSALESGSATGEYPSGQRMAAVNRPARPSQVRILPPPSDRPRRVDRPRFERSVARSGQAVIWAKRRLTIPVAPFDEAGLSIGDRVRVRAGGPGRVILERIDPVARDRLAPDDRAGG